jgi:hypothetical protein
MIGTTFVFLAFSLVVSEFTALTLLDTTTKPCVESETSFSSQPLQINMAGIASVFVLKKIAPCKNTPSATFLLVRSHLKGKASNVMNTT